jgi:anti-sigma regulatory factor (Ser/Thr protein kinase)
LELQFSLTNDSALLYLLVAYLRDRLASFGVCDSTNLVRVGIALEEALLNALYHGNLEISAEELAQASVELLESGKPPAILRRHENAQFKERRIYVRAELSPGEARFVIRDEGRGFDAAAHLPLVIEDEPTRPSGRGLELMHAFMDEVRFNDRGNEVTLVKRRAA